MVLDQKLYLLRRRLLNLSCWARTSTTRLCLLLLCWNDLQNWALNDLVLLASSWSADCILVDWWLLWFFNLLGNGSRSFCSSLGLLSLSLLLFFLCQQNWELSLLIDFECLKRLQNTLEIGLLVSQFFSLLLCEINSSFLLLLLFCSLDVIEFLDLVTDTLVEFPRERREIHDILAKEVLGSLLEFCYFNLLCLIRFAWHFPMNLKDD